MKKLVIALVTICTIGMTNAQNSNNPIYLSSEYNFGNYSGINLNLNYILQNGYSIQAGFSGLLREAESTPDDFKTGAVSDIFLVGFSEPFDEFNSYRLLGGKVFNLNNNGTIRLNLLAGIGYSSTKEPVNWKKLSESKIDDNYSYDYEKQNTVSLIVNPKIEFPFSNYFGFSISPELQINKERTYVGVGFGLLLGLLK